MFNLDQVLGTLQRDPNARQAAMTGAAGVATGMLMGGGGKKFMGSAMRLGTLAALGGLAYQAWQRHQQNEAAAGRTGYGSSDQDAFIPGPDDGRSHEELGRSLVRAMIAAAKADGKIDADEKERIFKKLETMPLQAEEKAFVFDELSGPLDIEAVVARADTPEHAAEIYAASLVAIDSDTTEERAYLGELAFRLNLEPGLVAEIHKAAGTADAGHPVQHTSDQYISRSGL